jgi:hypothetical protein
MNVYKKPVYLSLVGLSSLVCLWVRPRAYLRLENLKGALLWLAPALRANIKLGWKGLPGANTLAYNEHLYITVVN